MKPEVSKRRKGRLLDLHPWVAEEFPIERPVLQPKKYSLKERFGKFLKQEDDVGKS